MLDHFILGQIIPDANIPEDIESYNCEENKVKTIRSLYDVKTREFQGLRKIIGLINVREDDKVFIFDYGFNKNFYNPTFSKSIKEYFHRFSGNVFNNHKSKVLNEKRETFSKLLSFLPSTTDRKEEINRHLSNVSLHPIKFCYNDFQKLSPSNSTFVPSDLGERRNVASEIVVEFLKRAPRLLT